MHLTPAFAPDPLAGVAPLDRAAPAARVAALRRDCLRGPCGQDPQDDRRLFARAASLFALAFVTLAASFLPYMIPFSVTVEQAAAPDSSLRFLFWGAGVFVFPLTLLYTAAVYFVFRGRVDQHDTATEMHC